IRIQARQQQRPPARPGIARPKAPDLVFTEHVVSGKYLVGPLSCQDDLYTAGSYQFRELQQRSRRRAHHWSLGKSNYIRKRLADFGIAHLDVAMVRLEVSDHLTLVVAFIEMCVLETNGKGRQVVVVEALDQGGQDR